MPNWKKLIVSGSDAAIPSVSTTGDFTIDAGTDIILDADGADIILKDGGTTFGRLKRSSSHFVIKSDTNDKDIQFKGVDNSATITALTLDMSAAGAATFNSTISASGAFFHGLSAQNSEATALVINGSNVVGKRELGTGAFAEAITNNNQIDNGAGYVTSNTMGSGFTVSATTDSNATTITQGDDLFFRAGTGITCETTADGEVTISSTVTNTNTMGSGFVLEDGDGTEVTITENKEVKFVEGESIDINWTDTSNGSDGDPYDLTFSLKTAGPGEGTYGSTDDGIKIDTITVDAYGRITAVATGNTGNGDITAVRLDGDTGSTAASSGAFAAVIAGGNAITTSVSDATLTVDHNDTSTQASVNNSGNTVIQDITLDTYGHVTALGSTTLSIPTNNNELDNGAGYTTNTGTVTGTGSSNRIARWSSSTNISSVSDLTFDGVTLVAGTDGATGGRVRTGDGSVSNPAFSFVGDTNTGFYCSTTDTIAAACNGIQKLTINSNGMKINNGALGVNVNTSATDGRIDASNDIVAYSTSDERLKENVKPIENALDKVSKIGGYEFDWKELTEEEKETIHGNEGHDVGVIAQEIEKVLPEVVTERDSGYKAVKYEKIVPLLIESIKDLKAEIEELKGKL